MKKILFKIFGISLLLPSTTFAQGLQNPIGCDDINCILGAFSYALFIVGPPIAVIMILVGSFQVMTAGGDTEKLQKGKKTIWYAVIGIFIVFVAGGINQIVRGLLS